jgi:hypothetical protein
MDAKPTPIKTTVVNIHHEPCEVYIGRGGKGQSGYFGNPHPVYAKGKSWTRCQRCDREHSREESVEAYAQDFYIWTKGESDFKNEVEKLRGKKLGCFCRPRDGFKGKVLCHGQIIASYLDGGAPEEVE